MLPPMLHSPLPPVVEPMFRAEELLVALHSMDPARHSLPLKNILLAVDTALKSPETFPQQVRMAGGGGCSSR